MAQKFPPPALTESTREEINKIFPGPRQREVIAAMLTKEGFRRWTPYCDYNGQAQGLSYHRTMKSSLADKVAKLDLSVLEETSGPRGGLRIRLVDTREVTK